ncbi:MAG: glycosyltransferase, partial [Pricia sp.]
GLKVSEFAFMVKNKVRLQGLARLGMPVPLTGTGMAFPFEALSEVDLATGDIVEDMRLGVELAEKDMGAQYCDQAQVYSYFPNSESAEKTQRERWEHGHLSTIKRFAPRLLKRALGKPSLKALVMMLDLLVPPLSLLVMMIGAALAAASAWGYYFDDWIHAKILGGYFMLLLLTILMTWYIHGRSILSLGELAHIPIYVVSKIFLYAGYLVRKQTAWIRTDRH